MSNTEKLLESAKDEYLKRSIELFNKEPNELSIEECKKLDRYMKDLAHPIWKPIICDGKPTCYIVSNIGEIMNAKTNKILAHTFSKKKYLIVNLYFQDKRHTKSIHRLVAEAFIPNPENKPQVNHINGNKQCNWVENLEWNTCQENIQHAIKHGLRHDGVGEDANRSVYTTKQVEEVCRLLEERKKTNVEIAEITGVDVSNISKIKCKEIWTHISSKYNIPKPIQNATGENSAASKYTTNQIHKVCKMLVNGYNMKDIEKESGVGYDMIWRIKNGKNWKEVFNQYKYNLKSA